MEAHEATATTRPSRRHRWLLILPFLWQLALVPAVNDVRWAPLNVPFPMLWQMAGVVFSAIVIGTVFALDRRAGADHDDDDLPSPSGAGSDGESR